MLISGIGHIIHSTVFAIQSVLHMCVCVKESIVRSHKLIQRNVWAVFIRFSYLCSYASKLYCFTHFIGRCVNESLQRKLNVRRRQMACEVSRRTLYLSRYFCLHENPCWQAYFGCYCSVFISFGVNKSWKSEMFTKKNRPKKSPVKN